MTHAGQPPAAAARVFGDALPTAARYADLLTGPGIEWGLLGPREASQIWERHILNCAVLTELIDESGSLIDLGSGAGLPGIVLAVARPDIQVTLVEPLARRVAFLERAVDELALTNVRTIRARADELPDGLQADVVTARAVAPLARLAQWSLPLVVDGGRMLAIKGKSAEDELASASAGLARLGGTQPAVLRCGVDILAVPTTVVSVRRAARKRTHSATSRRRR